MFKYSIDEYIASEQKNSAEKLLDGIRKKCRIQVSPELDEALTSYKMNSFGFLQEVHAVAEKCGEPIVFVAAERDNYWPDRILADFKTGFDKLDKPWADPLPYIEYSFSNRVKLSSSFGDRYLQHVFIFFFTKYHGFDGARDCMLYYLNKFNNLKAFV
jgi:hypothetical protein